MPGVRPELWAKLSRNVRTLTTGEAMSKTYRVTLNVVVYVNAEDEDAAEVVAEKVLGTLDFVRDGIDEAEGIDWEVMETETEEG